MTSKSREREVDMSRIFPFSGVTCSIKLVREVLSRLADPLGARLLKDEVIKRSKVVFPALSGSIPFRCLFGQIFKFVQFGSVVVLREVADHKLVY